MRVPTPLTTSRINAQRPGDTRKVICDGGARGLYLITGPKPGGHRSWEFRFVSPATKKQSSLTLGRYPAMSISDARRVAEEQRTILEKGEDPGQAKKKLIAETTLTLEVAAKAWDAARAGTADEHTRQTAMRRLEMHVFPELGKKPLRLITQRELVSVLDAIKAAGQPDTANRTCSALSMVYRWSIARGDVDRDVASAVKTNYPKAAQSHYAAITDPVAFGGMLRAIDGYGGYIVRQALRFDALTFVRSGELRGAAWAEMTLDGDEPTWTIPAVRMKVKANGDHVVPLSKQAVEILRETKRVSGNRALVFPGLRPGKPLSDATLNAALTTLGYPGDVHRVHGFRSSASTMLNAIASKNSYRDFNPESIEEQLAHRSTDVVRMAYHRGNQLAQRRTMMQCWADELDRLRGLK